MGIEAFDLSPNVLSSMASRVKYKSLNRKINVLCFSNLSRCSFQHSQTPGYCLSSFKNCALEQATPSAYPGQLIHVLSHSGLSPCW